ncbi:helix-turn-helix domain-containing protein [Actinomadura harenae]|uniref:XRE family transcriptional regulator n=1 Tax=Actinomadura harenae TaxID=2483351 RepID=A0A3M2LYV9_9ACTN|nr:helix-turn-helix transcriptional regulator [Actinomadura harenae]RMI41783.1 XRE family transcriptional regulator [Actinomadura harenae]
MPSTFEDQREPDPQPPVVQDEEAPVAARVGWDQAKISRIENAWMRVTVGEVMELCEVYGLNAERRSALVQLAREARTAGWWEPYRDVVKEGFSDYLAFEAEADTYYGFHNHLVPGIFQTPDYARAILQSIPYARSPEDADRIAEVRLARQTRLDASHGSRSLQVWHVLDEGALRRIVGGPSVMHEQLVRLAEISQLPNVSLQVIPFGAGTHSALDGPFTLLGFDDYPDVLYVEHFGGCQYYEQPAELKRASVAFEHLRSSAFNTVDSAAFVRQIAHEMGMTTRGVSQ